jgi:lysylphosphatidylglycerol synthetase-like protein (DUF2156 family)
MSTVPLTPYSGETVNHLFYKLSIFLSSLCVLHCLATPLVLLLLPAVATYFSETVEIALVLSVIPISMAGFLPTWFRHKNYRLLWLYLISIGLILFSQFVIHTGHDQVAPGSMPTLNWVRTGVTFAGALLLARVVYQNNRHTHYCTHPHHHHDTVRPVPDLPPSEK